MLPITDESEVTTIHVIPNTILCEAAEKCLLSPQHCYQKIRTICKYSLFVYVVA